MKLDLYNFSIGYNYYRGSAAFLVLQCSKIVVDLQL